MISHLMMGKVDLVVLADHLLEDSQALVLHLEVLDHGVKLMMISESFGMTLV